MNSPKKIYLDTSVISAHLDVLKPVRQLITSKWLEKDIWKYSVFVSDLVIQEINNTKDQIKRENLLLVLESVDIEIININDNHHELARYYRQKP